MIITTGSWITNDSSWGHLLHLKAVFSSIQICRWFFHKKCSFPPCTWSVCANARMHSSMKTWHIYTVYPSITHGLKCFIQEFFFLPKWTTDGVGEEAYVKKKKKNRSWLLNAWINAWKSESFENGFESIVKLWELCNYFASLFSASLKWVWREMFLVCLIWKHHISMTILKALTDNAKSWALIHHIFMNILKEYQSSAWCENTLWFVFL